MNPLKGKAAKRVRRTHPSGWLRRPIGIAFVLATVVIVPTAKFIGPLSRIAEAKFWAGAVAMLILLAWAARRFGRKKVGKTELQQEVLRARERWSAIERQWKLEAGGEGFAQRRLALEKLKADYERLPHERLRRLQELETNRESGQLTAFLDRCPLDGAHIKGVGETKITMLQSYGIETAADIIDQRVLAIPGAGPVLLKRLKAWRHKQEARFVFDPKKGVSPTDKATVEQRILTERTRLEKALMEGVAQLAALSKDILARRQALEQDARSAAEALLTAEADLRALA